MIADYVRGQPLDVKYRALKQRAIKQNRPWTDVITMLMMELAEAAAEGHAAELCYLSFDPANILIEDKYDRPRLYPVDFSAWIASIGQQVGTLRIPLDSLIYYAPELFEYTSLGVHDPHSCRHDIAKANQYALGMVALTLLQEGPPLQFRCLGDLSKLQKFHQDPRGFSASESEQDRLENSPWRRTAPALARVIWRMLERDPARRWDNMQEVAQQLRAVITSSANISTHVSQAKYCYVDHVAGKDDFYHRFYDCFFELSPDSLSHFANVNWKRQCQLLDNAIERLLNYRPVQNEPTTLTCIAKSHSHIGIDENEFEHFAQAFLDTLKSIPEFDIDTQFAWEAVLWPGIEYIKNMSRSTPENPPPTPCKAGKTGKTGAQKAGRKSGKSAKK
jgi:serine/threonine protein kinase